MSQLLRRTLIGSIVLIVISVVGGVVFGSAVSYSSQTSFCISCHEMEATVYQEYIKTKHYNNESGVRATCADCHVPRDMVNTVARKLFAVKDVVHHFLGTIDTIEKFEERRLVMAQRVWNNMENNDSLECRNCHQFSAMQLSEQRPRARKQHELAVQEGKTCIACHKGIAHKAVHVEKSSNPESADDLSLEF